MYNLYPFQATAELETRKRFISGQKRLLLTIPTGGGKTVIFSHIAAGAVKKNSTVHILVHRVELLRQTSSKLSAMGVSHGLISPHYTANLLQRVQVASIETYINRMKHLTAPDVIIIDEAHHAAAASWMKVVHSYPDSLILGVTATPVRSDGAPLLAEHGGIFDSLITGPQISELIDSGYLSPPIVYAPDTHPDTKKLRIKKGDFREDELERVMNVPVLTGNAIAHYKKICPGVPAIAFCVTVNHARRVAHEFREAGFSAYHLDGNMDDDARQAILEGLETGTVHVVTSCNLISEGTDVPAVICGIMLRPTKSIGLYLQQAGRILRTHAGKTNSILLDHAGNTIKHGLPDDDRDWISLMAPRVKRTRQGSPRASQYCEDCGRVFRSSECPACNEDRRYTSDNSQLQVIDHKQERKNAIAAARSLEDLQRLGKILGYKPNWAVHLYESRLQRT